MADAEAVLAVNVLATVDHHVAITRGVDVLETGWAKPFYWFVVRSGLTTMLICYGLT